MYIYIYILMYNVRSLLINVYINYWLYNTYIDVLLLIILYIY